MTINRIGTGTTLLEARVPEPDAMFGAGTCEQLFDSFDRRPDGTISRLDLVDRLDRTGLAADDCRIRAALSTIDSGVPAKGLTLEEFVQLSRANDGLVGRALRGDLVIPDFAGFAAELVGIHERLLDDRRGAVADYIPQLKNVDPDQLAIAVCTVDGQRFAIGQAHTGFCIQSVCKPINYCLALEEHGPEIVHRHVGREPSGRNFNALSFDDGGLPHNPMINAGAIMVCSLLRPGLDMADRFDLVAKCWRRLSGGGRVGFNNAVYLSERQTADRNFALAYSMRESQIFPAGTNLVETLEFYFQTCSIEVDAELVSVVAATLANGGVSPTMSGHVFSTSTVQRCLSLMSSCGMYDYSGEFAFEIGLPAKSGVSGALMIVIPKVMGICVWSPRLDRNGNSVRGIEFCRELVSRYNFHVFDGLVDGESSGKRDPRLRPEPEVCADTVDARIERARAADVVVFEPRPVSQAAAPPAPAGQHGPVDRAARKAFVNGYTRLLSQVCASGELARRLETEPATVLAALGLPTVAGARVTIVRTLDADPDLEAQAALWERGHATGRYILYVPHQLPRLDGTDPDTSLGNGAGRV